MLIYKITNKINNKIYIGLTTCSLKYRWSKHLTESRNQNNTKPLYKALRKYGEENFIIEELESTNDFQRLGELERDYIKKYNSQNPKIGYNLTAGGEKNQWDGNPAAKLTYDEIVQIREIYAMNELRCKECWELFKNKISYSGFQKVWDGITWQGIMDEVYTDENIETHKHQKSNPGSKNGNTMLDEQQVLAARIYYTTHTLQETYECFGKPMYSKDGFRGVLTRTFSHIPIYHKTKKQWTLNNEIIDINNYKPVSTISESGE